MAGHDQHTRPAARPTLIAAPLNLALVGALGERDSKGLASLFQARGFEGWFNLAAVDLQSIATSTIVSFDRQEVGASAEQELADGEAVTGCSKPQSGAILISGVGVRSVVEKPTAAWPLREEYINAS